MQRGAGQLTPLWQRISETPLAFDARFGADRLAELDAVTDTGLESPCSAGSPSARCSKAPSAARPISPASSCAIPRG